MCIGFLYRYTCFIQIFSLLYVYMYVSIQILVSKQICIYINIYAYTCSYSFLVLKLPPPPWAALRVCSSLFCFLPFILFLSFFHHSLSLSLSLSLSPSFYLSQRSLSLSISLSFPLVAHVFHTLTLGCSSQATAVSPCQPTCALQLQKHASTCM